MCSKIFLCVTLWEPRLMLRRKKHSTFGFPVNHEACKISNVVMSESQILPFCHSPAISHLWLILLCSIADNNQLKLAITILSHAWYWLRCQDMSWTWLYFRVVGNLSICLMMVCSHQMMKQICPVQCCPVQLYPCPSISIISALVTVIFVDSLNTLPLPAPPL